MWHLLLNSAPNPRAEWVPNSGREIIIILIFRSLSHDIDHQVDETSGLNSPKTEHKSAQSEHKKRLLL